MGILIGLIVATTLGILAGLAFRRYRFMPFVATAVVIAVYAIFYALVARWAGQCEYCDAYFNGYDYTRRDDLRLVLVWGGIATAGIILITWCVAGLTVLSAAIVRALRSPKADTL